MQRLTLALAALLLMLVVAIGLALLHSVSVPVLEGLGRQLRRLEEDVEQ